MTTLAQTLAATFWPRNIKIGRLFSAVEKVNAAHDARHEHQKLSNNDLKDIDISREDALGIAGYQPDVPFFMQPGFGSHRIRRNLHQNQNHSK